MALMVGYDSYVTLEEANRIISENFTSSSQQRTKWNSMSDEDKECTLRNSCRAIDSLDLAGRKSSSAQTLQFPRVQDRPVGYGYRLFISQFEDNGLIEPDADNGGIGKVKIAQAINAAYGAVYEDTVSAYNLTRIAGIVSKREMNISESYDNRSPIARDALIGIYTDKVYSILRPWASSSRLTM